METTAEVWGRVDGAEAEVYVSQVISPRCSAFFLTPISKLIVLALVDLTRLSDLFIQPWSVARMMKVKGMFQCIRPLPVSEAK